MEPVVLFLTGGAWIIGYKMWGTLLARTLVPFGIMVVIPDYRNYPVGTVVEMEHDVRTAIQWAFNHCGEYLQNYQRTHNLSIYMTLYFISYVLCNPF